MSACCWVFRHVCYALAGRVVDRPDGTLIAGDSYCLPPRRRFSRYWRATELRVGECCILLRRVTIELVTNRRQGPEPGIRTAVHIVLFSPSILIGSVNNPRLSGYALRPAVRSPGGTAVRCCRECNDHTRHRQHRVRVGHEHVCFRGDAARAGAHARRGRLPRSGELSEHRLLRCDPASVARGQRRVRRYTTRPGLSSSARSAGSPSGIRHTGPAHRIPQALVVDLHGAVFHRSPGTVDSFPQRTAHVRAAGSRRFWYLTEHRSTNAPYTSAWIRRMIGVL
jgi:hypothetical protein